MESAAASSTSVGVTETATPLSFSHLLSWLIGLQGRRIGIFTFNKPTERDSVPISSATGQFQGDFGRELDALDGRQSEALFLSVGGPGYLAGAFLPKDSFVSASRREDGIVHVERADGVIIGIDPRPESRVVSEL